jgi:cytosine deaminase
MGGERFDLIVRRARRPRDACGPPVDIGVRDGTIVAVAPHLAGWATQELVADGLVVPGFVDTHLHLDKAYLEGDDSSSVEEAIASVADLRPGFTYDDVHRRATRVLDAAIAHGTTLVRGHIEIDPPVGALALEACAQAARERAWAIDVELCVFAQQGLTGRPAAIELIADALATGTATAVGGAPYADVDPEGQLDAVFELAAAHDVDIDLHLDLAETVEGMLVERVCDLTDRMGRGGRVTIGHVTQLSLVSMPRYEAIAARLARSDVAVTVLPATDLYLMGRIDATAKPRGVLPLADLRARGVRCSVATNNVCNPFTPFGDGSLLRMANLYANVCHEGSRSALAECLELVTWRAASVMGADRYGCEVEDRADLVCLGTDDPADAVAQLPPPRWSVKGGRLVMSRADPAIHLPQKLTVATGTAYGGATP